MTSSSDAASWRPFALEVEEPPVSPGDAAGGAAPAAGSPSGTWLPSLRTHEQLTSERARRAIEEEAHARGRDEAIRAERERADARCATALLAVERVAGHLGAIAGEFARDRERDLQGLAIAVARHIVQHELTLDPLRVGELVRRALDLLPLDHTIEVRLHPEDLRTLAPSLEALRPEGRQVVVQWVGDPSVDRGGFLVETPQRIVDGRTDFALRALYDRFDHE